MDSVAGRYRTLKGTALLVGALLIAGCSSGGVASPFAGPTTAPSTGPTTSAPASHPTDAAGILAYEGEDRLDFLIEGARAEGKVVLYSVWSADLRATPMIEAFNEKYPFVTVEFTQLQSADIAQRVTEEAAGGRNDADLIESRFDTIAVLRNSKLLTPFWSPGLAEIPDGIKDPGGHFAADRQTPLVVVYNPDRVAAADVPDGWGDLASPEFADKLATINTSQATRFFGATLLINGEQYADLLRAQRLQVFSQSSDGLRQLIATGEVPIGFPISLGNVLKGAAAGEKIAWTAFDPNPMEVGYVGALAKAPHPYAAALFIDWLLSQEGQEAMVATGEGSARQGIAVPWPTDVKPFYSETKVGIDNYLDTYSNWQAKFSQLIGG